MARKGLLMMIMVKMMMIGCFNVFIEIGLQTSTFIRKRFSKIFVGTIFLFPIHAFSPRGIFGYLSKRCNGAYSFYSFI